MIVKLQRELRPVRDRTFKMTDESGMVNVKAPMTDEVLALLGDRNKVYVELMPSRDGEDIIAMVVAVEGW